MTRGSTVQVPIITTPDLGEMSAKFMCEKLGVKRIETQTYTLETL